MSQPGILDKSVSNLSINDLLSLKDLAEGWYCEYKREVPSPVSAAKSLSSFANTYGGWIFYGADASKESRCVEELRGIAAAEVPQAEIWLRQAVSAHMSPAVYFEHKVIYGPLPELGLSSDRAVIAIYVPIGANAPYIHSTGRIYRRVADESDPKAETDRHYLDLLWDRSKTLKEDLKALITDEPAYQSRSHPQPLLRLLIFHDVWRSRQSPCACGGDVFHKMMTEGALTFDTIFPTNAGFIARQARANNPLGPVFSWHHRRGCVDEISIPFNFYDMSNNQRVVDLGGYEYATAYVAKCRKLGAGHGRLIDLSVMYRLLMSIFVRLNDVLLHENSSTATACKLQISGVDGCIPFLDISDLLDTVEKYGVPIIAGNVIYAPTGYTPESLEPLINVANPNSEAESSSEYCAIMNCIVIFLLLCQALGVDIKATGYMDDEDKVLGWHDKLSAAAARFYGNSDLIKKRYSK